MPPSEAHTGLWLAELVRERVEELAAEFARDARDRIPFYRQLDPGMVHRLFVRFYEVFAEACALGNVAPLRPYFREIMKARLQVGVAPQEFIDLAVYSYEAMCRLLERERAAHPVEVAAALHRVQMLLQSIRLLLSELNLQFLTEQKA